MKWRGFIDTHYNSLIVFIMAENEHVKEVTDLRLQEREQTAEKKEEDVWDTGWPLNFVKLQPVIHNIRLPKHSTVGIVLGEIKSKVTTSHPNAELRPLEVFYRNITRSFRFLRRLRI